MTLKHTKVVVTADDGTSEVGSDEWNQDHTISGTSLALQFNNAGSLSEMSGTSWDDTNRSLTLTGATVTASHPVLDLSQVWSNAAVAFTGLRFNATNTASADLSALLDLQVGGSPRFRAGLANGGLSTLWLGQSTPSNTNYSAYCDGNFLVFNAPAGVQISIGGTGVLFGISSGVSLFSPTSSFGFSSNANPLSGSLDTGFFRDAAGILAQRNSTNAQTFRVYNTYTDASNYERGVFDWTTTANTLTIGTQAAGTGTGRNIIISSAGTIQFGDADAASPVAQTLRVQSVVAGTTNTAGVDWTLKGSVSTGTAAGGKIIFQTSPAGATGSTQNTLVPGLTITGPAQRGGVTQQPSVVVGNAAIATADTDGFLYIPTCAGTPTGTPTSFTGRVPIVYDTTNNKFYVYNGAWKGGTAPGAWS